MIDATLMVNRVSVLIQPLANLQAVLLLLDSVLKIPLIFDVVTRVVVRREGHVCGQISPVLVLFRVVRSLICFIPKLHLLVIIQQFYVQDTVPVLLTLNAA